MAEAKQRRAMVPYFKLFNHADFIDAVMIIIAILCSLLTGAASALESILIGDIFNIFISYNTAEQLYPALVFGSNQTTCTVNIAQQMLNELRNVSDEIFCDATKEGNIFSSASEFICDPDVILTEEATTFSLYFVIFGFGIFVTNFLADALWTTSASRQSRNLRIAYYKAILRHRISWFETSDTSLLEPEFIKSIENIQNGIGIQAGNIIREVTTFLIGIMWAFFISWKLAFVLLILLPIVAVLSALNIMETKKMQSSVERVYLKASAVASQALMSLRTVVAFGGEEKESERYEKLVKDTQSKAIRGALTTCVLAGCIFFAGIFMFGASFWYGSNLLVNCELEGGDSLKVLMLVLFGAFSLGAALPQLGVFISASYSAVSVFERIEKIPEMKPVVFRPQNCEGRVKFTKVHFSYPARPSVEILKGLSMEIEPGQKVAIVGPSGHGKSTILQLIQNFYEPSSGQVEIDGIATGELDPTWIHNHVAVVPQEPPLFNTSLRENILVANAEATQEQLEAAAITANAHTFITELPDGYNTYVGEGGIQLSGGQKQRVAIARALLRNPKILLLDEATSALDNQSEKQVQSALERASQGRTTITVAHRLHTVQNANVIVCIKSGQVTEAGTHHELLNGHGLYSELIQTQIRANENGEEPINGRKDHSLKRATLSLQSMGKRKRRIRALRNYASQNHSGWLGYHSITQQTVTKEMSQRKQYSQQKSNRLLFLWRFIRLDLPIVMLGVLLYGLIGGTHPIIGVILADVNAIFSESNKDRIVEVSMYTSIGFFGLATAAGLFYFLGSFVMSVSGERLTSRLRTQLFKAILYQSFGWHDNEENTTGSLTSILSTDTEKVKNGAGIQMGSIVLATVSILITLVVCFVTSWELSLVLAPAFPLIFFCYRMSYKLLYSSGSGKNNSLQVSAHLMTETVTNIKTVVSLGAEDYFIDVTSHCLHSHMIHSIRRSLLQAFVVSFTKGLIPMVYAAGWRLATLLVTSNRIEIAGVFRLFSTIVVTARNVMYALNATPQSSDAYEAGEKIMKMIRESEEVQDLRHITETIKMEHVFGHMSGRGLYFHYPSRPEYKVLRGLNLSVSPGETLAIVGATGSGKSTLVSLIEKFYNPTIGIINLDGQDIAGLDVKWLRSQIGYVQQEPVLFDANIEDNIRYGDLSREVSSGEIEEVARACNIHDFILSLPQGYNTNVGAGGTFLSGGQKQRIAIARALVRNPKLLLLDEATSSLDAESEQAVQQTLKRARVGRTSIVVAHRLSTIRDADCIAVVKQGQVVESGAHQQLMDLEGTYYKLVTSQA